jgi:hypothetical protein
VFPESSSRVVGLGCGLIYFTGLLEHGHYKSAPLPLLLRFLLPLHLLHLQPSKFRHDHLTRIVANQHSTSDRTQDQTQLPHPPTHSHKFDSELASLIMAKLTSHNSKPSIPKSTRVLRSHGKPPAARVGSQLKSQNASTVWATV